MTRTGTGPWWRIVVCLWLVLCTATAQPIQVPRIDTLTLPSDTLYPGPPSVPLTVNSQSKVPFKFMGLEPVITPSTYVGQPNFALISPSTGIAPQAVLVGVNPNVIAYMPSGEYEVDLVFATVDQPTFVARSTFRLFLQGQGAPSVSAVLNSASLRSTASPGQLVSIFGTHLSTPSLKGQLNEFGVYPNELGNTQVTFNGTVAPLLYVSNNQINTLVPYGLAGQKSVNVVVSRTHVPGVSSSPTTLPLLDTSPGIFTVDQSGSGQGLILNADPMIKNGASLNSAQNPAPKGSAITLFAAGAGLWNVPFSDGSIVLSGGPYTYGGVSFNSIAPTAPVALTIGGQRATILYVGAEGGAVSGMLQVNAVVPEGIGSGSQPIVLKIGDNDNSQQSVTISIK